jgi:hypothetical protein
MTEINHIDEDSLANKNPTAHQVQVKSSTRIRFFSWGQKFRAEVSKPVSASPLAIFRAVFGLLMVLAVIRFWARGWITELYVQPVFHFTYNGFAWVKPLGHYGTHALFALIGLSAWGIMLGWRTKFSAGLFFLSFTYAELMDKANYLNHYYFVSLIAFLLLWVNAGAVFSLDARRNRTSTKAHAFSRFVPRWHIGIFKTQIALVYFFAGLAKLHPDWLLEAQPLSLWLPAKAHLPLIGPFLDLKITAYAFSWFGAAFDLFIPFFLFWRRTSALAYGAVVIFHLLTAWLFPVIGVFPYVMLMAGTIFLPPEFHSRVIERILRISSYGLRFFKTPSFKQATEPASELVSTTHTALIPIGVVSSLGLFFLFQSLWPLRFMLYAGPLFWAEEGYRFSWRVMLMEKAGNAVFYVSDPNTGRTAEVETCEYLTPWQERMMTTQPDMILQFAQHIAADYRRKGLENPKVWAKSQVTLNGLGSRTFVDSTVNLATLPEGAPRLSWLQPYEGRR